MNRESWRLGVHSRVGFKGLWDPAFAPMMLDLGRVYGRMRTLCGIGKPGKEEKKVALMFESLGEIRTLVVKGERLVDDEEERGV